MKTLYAVLNSIGSLLFALHMYIMYMKVFDNYLVLYLSLVFLFSGHIFEVIFLKKKIKKLESEIVEKDKNGKSTAG